MKFEKNRLTTSHFGTIITRRSKTHCHNLIKILLYPKNLISKHIEFGRKYENKAIEIFEKKTSLTV
jgi:predicted glycosyltransferase